MAAAADPGPPVHGRVWRTNCESAGQALKARAETGISVPAAHLLLSSVIARTVPAAHVFARASHLQSIANLADRERRLVQHFDPISNPHHAFD